MFKILWKMAEIPSFGLFFLPDIRENEAQKKGY